MRSREIRALPEDETAEVTDAIFHRSPEHGTHIDAWGWLRVPGLGETATAWPLLCGRPVIGRAHQSTGTRNSIIHILDCFESVEPPEQTLNVRWQFFAHDILGRPPERLADAGEEIDVAETRGVLGFLHVTRVWLALFRSSQRTAPCLMNGLGAALRRHFHQCPKATALKWCVVTRSRIPGLGDMCWLARSGRAHG
jgi:hypothetical protein